MPAVTIVTRVNREGHSSVKHRSSNHKSKSESPFKLYVIRRRKEKVPLVEFMYLVFTRMPGESYRRRLRSLLLYLCYVFRALIISLVC